MKIYLLFAKNYDDTEIGDAYTTRTAAEAEALHSEFDVVEIELRDVTADAAARLTDVKNKRRDAADMAREEARLARVAERAENERRWQIEQEQQHADRQLLEDIKAGKIQIVRN